MPDEKSDTSIPFGRAERCKMDGIWIFFRKSFSKVEVCDTLYSIIFKLREKYFCGLFGSYCWT
jgi:hypothetical protein